MLGFASASMLLVAGMLAGGPPAAKQGESPDRDQAVTAEASADQGDEAAAEVSEPLSDEDLAREERWELRVLMSPYDLASFYRSGGSRGLYGATPSGSLSSFYRAAPSGRPAYWRVVPGEFALRGRRGPGSGFDIQDEEQLAPYGELGLRPYSSEPAGLGPDDPSSHPRASKARRPVDDSNREQ
jgi:hypothetical protein